MEKNTTLRVHGYVNQQEEVSKDTEHEEPCMLMYMYIYMCMPRHPDGYIYMYI